MTDFDRIVEVLGEHGITNKALANDLLTLMVDIAGDRLIAKERARFEIYQAILTNKMVKPEYMKTVYKLMKQAEEKLNG